MSRLGARGAGILFGVLTLAACSPSEPVANGNSITEQVRQPSAADALPAPATGLAVEDKSDVLEFAYAYPAAAAAIPTIATRLNQQLASSKAEARKMAEEDRNTARESGFPFHAHSLETKWSVEADTPRFLSLSSQTYVFTGGAHGMTGYSGLLWDKQRERLVPVDALMTSTAAFAGAVGERFCDALDAERAEKRGAPVVRSEDPDGFSACVDMLKQTLVPVSSDGAAIDGMKVIIGPYEAGPYAEGSYEILLPVDAAMLKAIKPEYERAFRGGRR